MISALLKKIIPAKYQFWLVSYKHTFTRFRRTFYSQNGEDVILPSAFPKNYKGFYVDVGAHHPYRISNTYLLYKRGWSGINIDANPDTIKLFQKARPDDINLCVGVSGKLDTLNYHRFSDPAVNTFSSEEAEHWKQKKWLTYLGNIPVETKPLVNIFRENIKAGQHIDVLSVDVEGLDLEVLESNDWNQYQPQVVVVEAHDFTLEGMYKHPIYQLLTTRGYQLQHKMKFSLIFELPKKNHA